MSLNWKEINLILEELDLPGFQIQAAAQSTFDVINLSLYKKSITRQLLIAISPEACRIHETSRPLQKRDKPLRFAQFLKSTIVNSRIEEAAQIGEDRIIRLKVKRGEFQYLLYVRLWSNAANFIITDEKGTVLDAMRRLPKKGEISGGHYFPQENAESKRCVKKEYSIRDLPGGGSFNSRIDAFYSDRNTTLSLEALREKARRKLEASSTRLQSALERLKAKENEFVSADRLREYGDLILANLAGIKQGDEWLNAETGANEKIQIKLDPLKKPSAQAELYYKQYSKAKKGISDLRAEIGAGEMELAEIKKKLELLFTEGFDPNQLEGIAAAKTYPSIAGEKKYPGLSFKRGDWLFLVGRDASENDALLRRYVKGNDMWLHARGVPGAYVFIKHQSGKTFPLDILLDAGNLAIFYSKGRNSGGGDVFYTQVKYLRRVKKGPKGSAPVGKVIPTQEKNLYIKISGERLKELESCRV